MKFTCDQCSTRYSISDEKVDGKVLKIRCKVCEFTMVVRGSDSRPGGSVSAVTAAASSVMDPIYEIEWYAAPDGQQVGPVPLERIRAMIRSGILSADSVVWNENLSDWTPAVDINELTSMFASKPKAPPPLPPTFQKPDQVSPVSLTPTEPSVAPAGRMISSDATIPNQQRAPVDHPTSMSAEDVQNALGPVTDRATLQYASPDHSEPGLRSVNSLTGPANAVYVPAATLDLPDSDDEPSSIADDFESANPLSNVGSRIEDGMVSQSEAAEESGDSTELMSLVEEGDDSGLEADVSEQDGAALKDTSTRRIERAEPDNDEPGFVPGSSRLEDEFRPDSSAPASIHGLPAIDVVSDEPSSIEPELNPDDVATLNVSTQASTVNISSEPAPVFPTQPSSVATERRAGPTVGKSSSAVSPGLIVAACLIGTTAMICAVIYFSKYRDKTDNKRGAVAQIKADASTQIASVQIVDAGPSVRPIKAMVLPVVKDQPAADSKRRLKTEAEKPISNVKTPKGKRRKSGVEKPQKKPFKPERKKAESTKPRTAKTVKAKVPKSNETVLSSKETKRRPERATEGKTSSKASNRDSKREASSTSKKKKAEPRTRRNFMLAGGPSSSIPDPTLRSQKRSATSSKQANGLSQGVVNGVASRYVGAMQGCYNRHLKKDPTFNPGRLMLRFQIRPTGLTAKVRVLGKGGSSLSSGILSKCLKRLVKRWRFPTFQGSPFDTHFPLVFQRQF